MNCSPPGFSVHGTSQARILESVAPGDLPHPGIEPISPVLAGGFFTTERHLESPYLSFLHPNFPTCEMGDMGFPGGASGEEPTC